MELWKAIVLTVTIIIVGVGVSALSNELGKIVFPLVVFVSAFLISKDAGKVHPERYVSKMGFDSTSLFILTIIFWAIIFPGYLGLRYKIKNGLVPLREGVNMNAANSISAVSASGKKPNNKLAVLLIVLFLILLFSTMIVTTIISIGK